jgi:hypothetical protein
MQGDLVHVDRQLGAAEREAGGVGDLQDTGSPLCMTAQRTSDWPCRDDLEPTIWILSVSDIVQ